MSEFTDQRLALAKRWRDLSTDPDLRRVMASIVARKGYSHWSDMLAEHPDEFGMLVDEMESLNVQVPPE